MAMDIVMVKGNNKIKISPDFKEYYEKQGFTVEGENKKISVEKETKKIIKESNKKTED